MLKDASNLARWGKDSGVKLYYAILKKYAPKNDPKAVANIYGMAAAYTMVDVLKRARNLGDPKSILEAITATNYNSIVGPVRWAGGPVKNVSKTPLVSGQWQRRGTDFNLVITQNQTAPQIPVGGKLELLT